MPFGGDERRLRDSGEREDRRRVSVKMTCRPPLLPRLLTDRSTGSIWIGGHSACFFLFKKIETFILKKLNTFLNTNNRIK